MTSRSRRKHIEAIQPQTRSEGVTIVKRLVTFLVSVAFVTGAAGFAVAQTSTQPTTPPPATTPAPAPKDKAAEKKAEMTGKMPAKNAAGLVKSASADSVVVSGKEKVQGAKEMKDAEWTFAIDSKTAIRKAGKAATAADLKPGDQVHVRYMDHDGKATAVAIQVRPATSAAATKPAEKK